MLLELSLLPVEIQQQILNIKANEAIHIVNNGHIIKQLTQTHNDNFAFDMQRIQQSIESGVVDVPKFNTHEEFLKWLNR